MMYGELEPGMILLADADDVNEHDRTYLVVSVNRFDNTAIDPTDLTSVRIDWLVTQRNGEIVYCRSCLSYAESRISWGTLVT